LTAKGIVFQSVNYLEEPLSEHELRQLLHRAGLRPQDAIRTNEVAYREHVAGQNLSDDPELIQRPIVVRGKKAVLARSPDKLAEIDIE